MIYLDACFIYTVFVCIFGPYLQYILVFAYFLVLYTLLKKRVSLCRMMRVFPADVRPGWKPLHLDKKLTLFECLYGVKEHLVIFTFLQTCIWSKGRRSRSTLMLLVLDDRSPRGRMRPYRARTSQTACGPDRGLQWNRWSRRRFWCVYCEFPRVYLWTCRSCLDP